MSQIYSTEPQTSGRVVFETTCGPIEIQLWCRECPGTTRLFLQLCLDGFYDGMVFHRVVPNFLVQTGALRQGRNAKSTASESETKSYRKKVRADEAWERRRYELNSRIRFNHRGQVAMALDINEDDDDLISMQPQFFITLDEASHLDGKHILFGTVSGPTVFNAIRIGNTDVDEETSQPTIIEEAPRIERVKILENPIHTDINPSPVIPWKSLGEDRTSQRKKKKRKGVKNARLLSFGDEFGDNQLETDTGGIVSSHDVIQSKSLSNEVDKTLTDALQRSESAKKAESKFRRKKEREEEEVNVVAETTETQAKPIQESQVQLSSSSSSPRVQHENRAGLTRHSTEKNSNAPISDIKGKHVPKAGKKEKLSLVEARRARYRTKKTADKRKREEDTMEKLMAFQSKVKQEVSATSRRKISRDGGEAGAPNQPDGVEGYKGQVLEVENDDDVQQGWMKTKFKCKKHMDQDAKLGGDGRSSLDDYKVIDGKRMSNTGKRNIKQRDRRNYDR